MRRTHLPATLAFLINILSGIAPVEACLLSNETAHAYSAFQPLVSIKTSTSTITRFLGPRAQIQYQVRMPSDGKIAIRASSSTNADIDIQIHGPDLALVCRDFRQTSLAACGESVPAGLYIVSVINWSSETTQITIETERRT